MAYDMDHVNYNIVEIANIKILLEVILIIPLLLVTMSLLPNDNNSNNTISRNALAHGLKNSHNDNVMDTNVLATNGVYTYISSFPHDQSLTYTSLSNPRSVLPPIVVMNYSSIEYPGHLLTYKYRDSNSLGQLNPPTKTFSIINETTDDLDTAMTAEEIMKQTILSPSIVIRNGSELGFVIKNNPPILEPDSISVSAYTPPPDIKSVKVLDVTTEESSNGCKFDLRLDKGEYLILTTVTWLSDDRDRRDEIGYAFYSWMVKVV